MEKLTLAVVWLIRSISHGHSMFIGGTEAAVLNDNTDIRVSIKIDRLDSLIKLAMLFIQ